MIDDVKTPPTEVYLENKVRYLANLVFILNRKKRGKLKFSKLLETVL